MDELNHDVTRLILEFYISTAKYDPQLRRRSHLLALRLVSKKWKAAIEAIDLVWSIGWGKTTTTFKSKHLDLKICNGSKKKRIVFSTEIIMVPCDYMWHFSHLEHEKIQFKALLTKKRMRVYKRLVKGRKKARQELDIIEKELRFFQ